MTGFIQGERIVARFVLIERRGESATNEIWRALDETSGAQVALKLVRREVADARSWAALQRECVIAQRLHSAVPGIRVVRLDEPVRDARTSALPMQLAASDARTLRGKPCARIVPVLIDLAEALRDAHAQGIVHRDLKPANVLLDFRGRALLADFGAAAIDGRVPESAPYSPLSAPPQQTAGAAASIADDIFGFGALMLELLTGYPPNFPDAGGRSAYTHPVPPALDALVGAMLAVEESSRPRSMDEVLAVLRSLDLVGVDVDASAMLDRIVPAAPIDTMARQPAAAGRGSLGWIGAGVLMAALAAVFLWLPKLAVVTSAPEATDKPGVSKETAQALMTAQQDDEARRRYAQLRAEFRKSLESLELRGAASWSGVAFAAAKTLGESAEVAERDGQREIALDRLQTASQRLARIESTRNEALRQQLEIGSRALAATRLAEAQAAFSLAMQIEPQDAAARKGLARVTRLATVIDRLAEAEAALLEGDALHALQLFEQVLRADGENSAARDGVAKARAILGSDRYARELGDALQELRNGNPTRAREAFARAKTLRPEGVEVREGLIQVESLDAKLDLDGLRRNATELEASERWAEALARYEALLARDPSLVFARESANRVRPRAELARRLDNLIGNPTRLAAPEVRTEAESLLSRAASIPGDAPRLRGQATALRAQIARYDVPVKLVIRSDGFTQVTVQKVRSLGVVTRAELELKPGRYVLVGTRVGFRDVRREVLLKPGEAASTIELSCSEVIS